jgi:NADH-quinone oxidoreductase subunit J
MSLATGAFFVFAVGAIATAILMITRKNAIPAALCLITHFFCLSGLYLTLQAQLLAALQVLVYAGAIMVLVVFVIMLLNPETEVKSAKHSQVRTILAIVFVGVLGLQLLALLPKSAIVGSVEELGRVLYTDYLFPFEAVSLLLLTAVVGALTLAKRKLLS